jgi:2-phosphoglycerate kinase
MTQRRFGEPLPLGDDRLPYSKGLMARALIAVGVPADRAYQLARALEVDLAGTGERTVGLERFEEVARDVLGDEAGEHAVQRLRRLEDLHALDMPLIVLIGGTTGTGKSTIA